jgi:NAD-dependent deacetylase
VPLLEKFRAEQKVPPCATCGGRLKSATVSFGQALPPEVLDESHELAAASDVFLAIGSSLVVYPAAGLPDVARRSGAHLVIINRDPTDFDDAADVVIREPIGATLAQIDAALRSGG